MVSGRTRDRERAKAGAEANDAASPLRRWVGLPLLLSYTLLLMLASLVPEVRPRVLDTPYEFARSVLDVAGIRSGHVLMRSNYPGDYRFQSYCMIVRGQGEGSERVFLFPRDGVCPRHGFRPRLPPMERALYRVLRSAWWQALLAERQPAGPHKRRARSTLARIATHYCQREEVRGLARPRISLAWYVYEVSYDSGDLRRGNFLHFGWLCDEARLVNESWFPSDSQLLRFWGSPPWD